MKKMIKIWIIIFAMLTGSLLFIGYNVKKQNKDYLTLENDMIEAGDIYLKTENVELKLNEKKQIDINELINKELIEKEKVDELKCEGYITIEKNLKGLEFYPYIKCDNYETIE